MKINAQLTKQFQPKFEFMAPPHMDFTKNKEGDYLNANVQAWWLGFMLSEMRNLKSDDKRKTHFIIARMSEKGFPYFSSRPYVHNSRTKAVLEAEKLSNQFPNDPFAIYRMEERIVNGNRFKIKIYTVYWNDNRRTVVKGLDLNNALKRSGFDPIEAQNNIQWHDEGITNLYQIRWDDEQIVLESGVNVKQAIYKAGEKKYPNLNKSQHPLNFLRSHIKSNPCVNVERVNLIVPMDEYFKETISETIPE